MRVLLDLRSVHPGLTGIGRYALNLLDSLLEISRGIEIEAITLEAGREYLGDRRAALLHVITKRADTWEDMGFSDFVSDLDVDVFHSPLFRLPPVRGFATVLTLHDVVPKARPDLTSQDFHSFFERSVPQAVRGASHLVTVSSYSREDILRFYPSARGRLSVIHEPVSPIFRAYPPAAYLATLRGFGLEPGYLLSVGAIDRRKNLAKTLEAYALLLNEVQEAPVLVIVGEPSGDGYDPREDIGRLELASHVRLLGRVSDRELAHLYPGAELLVFPSLYEGFGLPVVEAMASGTPVVTSNITSLPEIAGEAAFLVNPGEAQSIKEGMKRVLSDSEIRASLTRKGLVRASHFSLKRQGEELCALYMRLAREAA